ncbi:MAG TPA: ATP-binding protein [Clostridia bacterium]|mgnify:CR=1 FL=1|nr:MAG: Alkaline phosphatase synthesis sensor protein PhoR [Firmicutes bacterium ADurb.Bin146]HOD92420.1 ATP-binding protein [Clostridia bacterium]HQM38777.1 ATP-binding protein [Clostridia bacterium]
MKQNVFSTTLRRFVTYITIIVLLFSAIIIFQAWYSILNMQSYNAQNIYPLVKNELDQRRILLYSNLSSSAFNAQAYLYDTIEKLAVMNNKMIWIFDQDGRLISHAPRLESLKTILETRQTSTINYLPETTGYSAFFESEDAYISNSRIFKDIFENEEIVGRSYVFIDEYNTSKTNPEHMTRIAICISSYNQSEKEVFLSNILLLIVPIVLFSVLSIILIAIFAKTVSKPLNEFLTLARSVSQGNLKVRISYNDDKTEIGELSKTFNNMMDKLEKTENQRAEFASNVAHELRTPMTTIGGFIEGILDGTIPQEKHATYLKRVSDEIKRLTNMVKDLLILSKMDADDVPLVKNRFDINDMIRKSIIRFEDEITRKKLYINVNFSDETTFVYANADDIERVLINLIHNAIKFTNEGGTVSISVELRKNKVYVFVRDNGIGIDQDDLQNIWTRFYKSDKSRGRDRSGTGLGLSIVFSVIKRHGEIIEVRSQKGIGTEFIFTLENAEEIENSQKVNK